MRSFWLIFKHCDLVSTCRYKHSVQKKSHFISCFGFFGSNSIKSSIWGKNSNEIILVEFQTLWFMLQHEHLMRKIRKLSTVVQEENEIELVSTLQSQIQPALPIKDYNTEFWTLSCEMRILMHDIIENKDSQPHCGKNQLFSPEIDVWETWILSNMRF